MKVLLVVIQVTNYGASWGEQVPNHGNGQYTTLVLGLVRMWTGVQKAKENVQKQRDRTYMTSTLGPPSSSCLIPFIQGVDGALPVGHTPTRHTNFAPHRT